MDTIKLDVQGMSCGGCEESIQKAVSRLEGVAQVTASHEAGTVEVQTKSAVDVAAIRTAIEDAGFDVVPA